MVRVATYAHDQKGLEKNAGREGIHGKAGRVDLNPSNIQDTLPFTRGLVVAGPAGLGWIAEEISIFSCESFEEDGDE